MSANMVPISTERVREVLNESIQGLLKNKVILISGGNKGVGAELAAECGRQGAKVAIAARNTEYANRVLAEAKEKGYDITFIPTDLRKIDEIRHMVEETVKTYGRIDGYVNYAGLLPAATITESEEDMFEEVFSVNIKAAMFACKYIIPEMQRIGGGSIVFIGSPHAYGGDKDRTVYALSKGALLTLMKHVSSHYQSDQIRSNWVTMGWIPTPGEMTLRHAQGRDLDWLRNIAEELTPAGRLLAPVDIIPGVIYFLSDLSPMVSATEMDMTGGLKCR